MSLLTGINEFFGLDIGTTAVRLVQLSDHGTTKALVKYAYVPIEANLGLSDSREDQQKLLKIISSLIASANVTTKNVAVGIPSKLVFTTVADMTRLDPKDMAKSIKYQASTLIPTAAANSKIDFAVIGDSPKDKTKVELLLSSVPNSFSEHRLDLLESIGLNVIAFEPDNLALARAMTQPGATAPQMVIDIGSSNTDLVVTMNDAPHLTRSIPLGIDAVIKAAMQNMGLEKKQAEEVIFKFGLNKGKLEGQVYEAIITTIDMLIGEMDKSIKFFQSKYTDKKIELIIVTGAASTMPEFPLHLANKFGINVEIGNAWRNVTYDSSRQNELSSISSTFGVAVGLAERKE